MLGMHPTKPMQLPLLGMVTAKVWEKITNILKPKVNVLK